MATKVSLRITKGSSQGKLYSFEQHESLLAGRADDCSLCFTDKTVSRYHCLFTITPPDIVVRDCGSLNGTFLNGALLGQRKPGSTTQEAQETVHDTVALKHGDRLRLGKDCEIEIIIDDDTQQQPNLEPINQQQGKTKQHPSPQTVSDEQCSICGRKLEDEYKSTRICRACYDEPTRAIKYILGLAMGRRSNEHVELPGYNIIRQLGKGGMGIVWLIENESTGERYALKVMLPDKIPNEHDTHIFLREAYTGCALQHNNIVKHHRFGRKGNIFYILMELCLGGSANNLIAAKGGSLGRNPQDMLIATSIMLQTLDGLHYAHNATVPAILADNSTILCNGVVHRDLKPANILIANEDLARPVVKICDFGLSKAYDAAGLTDLTKPKTVGGTYYFMARQQLRNYRYAKPDVDVWAAAACYYNLLTGAFVRNFGSTRSDMEDVMTCNAVPVLQRNPFIPIDIANVIDRALVESPDFGVNSFVNELFGNSTLTVEHPQALALKLYLWNSLSSELKEKLLDILPDFTKTNLDV